MIEILFFSLMMFLYNGIVKVTASPEAVVQQPLWPVDSITTEYGIGLDFSDTLV
jgi:hypothetical protein